MPTVTYTQPDGTTKDIEVKVGQSIKDGAVNNLIPGILAECGGACACATCHIYIDDQWFGKVGPAEDIEKDMLDFAEDVKDNSRLSCQVDMNEDLNGLIVHVPENQ